MKLQVKYLRNFFWIGPFLLLTAACQTTIPLDFAATRAPTAFEEHQDYLAMPVSYAPVAKARNDLEKQRRISLKNRGEAHVTVLTPPEYKSLGGAVSIQEINNIAKNNSMTPTDLEFICVGRGQLIRQNPTESKMETYFIVVKSEGLLKIRSEIEELLKQRTAKVSSQSFSAQPFYPHITLGFTDRDLHESDGIIKDDRSCISPLMNESSP